MAIFLKAYKVITTEKKSHLVFLNLKKFYINENRSFYDEFQWKNDFVGINIYDPKAWRKYLAEYIMPNGKNLPTNTEDGFSIVYEVIVIGTSKPMQEYFGIKTGPGNQGGRICLFPGYDEQHNKRPLEKYGWLRK